MSVSAVAKKQYEKITNAAAKWSKNTPLPQEGWITTVRKALGMSVSDLAARMEVSREAIYQAQRNEMTGSITISQLDKIAKAMGGKLVYAITPEHGDIESVIMQQARKKAAKRIRNVRVHMALEKQSSGLENTHDAIERKAKELAEKQPRGFWR